MSYVYYLDEPGMRRPLSKFIKEWRDDESWIDDEAYKGIKRKIEADMKNFLRAQMPQRNRYSRR